MNDAVITRMRDRARQLRQIADRAHDPRMIEIVLKMAGEVEADAARLEADAAAEEPTSKP